MTAAQPTFAQLKKSFLDSGYEIRFFPRKKLEELALDAPSQVKRHLDSDVMGLIMPDEGIIGLAEDLRGTDEGAVTLLHEMLHLHFEDLDEESIEATTHELEQQLTPAQFGFLQFLAS